MANPVGGNTEVIRPATTVSLGAYSANDNLGGIIEIARAARQVGDGMILQDVFLTDEADQDPVLELLFFDTLPAETYTDNAAMPTLAGDTANLIARASVAAADWVTQGGVAMAQLENLGITLNALKGETSIWMVIAVTNTPTFVAADDLRILLGFLQD